MGGECTGEVIIYGLWFDFMRELEFYKRFVVIGYRY